MTAPNIEMIAASLQSCSLGRGRGRGGGGEPSPPPPPSSPLVDDQTDESEGVTVELNSEVALPYPWEQCLDMRTGEVYYINWRNGTRTTEDPRTFSTHHPSSYYLEPSDDDDDDEEEEEDDEEEEETSSGDEDAGSTDNEEDTGETSFTSGLSSVSSPSSSSATSAPEAGPTLVAAGCKSCFMYFMVPKRVQDCPRCGGLLLHLGRNGCF